MRKREGENETRGCWAAERSTDLTDGRHLLRSPPSTLLVRACTVLIGCANDGWIDSWSHRSGNNPFETGQPIIRSVSQSFTQHGSLRYQLYVELTILQHYVELSTIIAPVVALFSAWLHRGRKLALYLILSSPQFLLSQAILTETRLASI